MKKRSIGRRRRRGERAISGQLILILVLLALGMTIGLRPIDTPYLTLLRQGEEHAARGERAAALAAYQEAAHLIPTAPEPHLRSARVALDWGRPDTALAAIATAERLAANGHHTDPALEMRLTELRLATHRAQADWQAVIRSGEKLLHMLPANSTGAQATRHTVATAHLERRDWAAARAEYETILSVDPTDQQAHERLGALLLGDESTAIQHLYAADTDLAGQLLAALQIASPAEDPAYTAALVGRTLFEANEWGLATYQFERALSHNPGYADARAHLGYLLSQRGYTDEAFSHLVGATVDAPDSPLAHAFLGLHYDRLGDSAAARAQYEAAYDLDPQNPAICVEIAQTWIAENHYVAAEIWLQEAVSLQPADPTFWKILARFYLDHTITAEGKALAATSELIKLAPEDAEANDLHGWALFQAGRYATARYYLERSRSLDPTLAWPHYHLGRVWIILRRENLARESFNRAVDLDRTGEIAPLVERALR